jgi:RNA polymerase sigma factor (sigma-70 family)
MPPLLSPVLLRTQSDERLTALTARGHDGAFEAIVLRYRRPLLRHARRMLGDGRAEDVVQAALVAAWGALRDGAEVGDLRPWLYRIVTNGALNALRRADTGDAPLHGAVPGGPAADPCAELERRDEVRRALDGLAALPDRQRAALLATAVAGRPHAEVAAELGLSEGAVRQLVHRARARLRGAATALTPLPVVSGLASAHALTATRVAELATCGAGAGAAAAGLKLGAVTLVTGALVGGVPQIAGLARHDAATAPAARAAAGDAGPGAAAATPPSRAALVPTGMRRAAPPARTGAAVRHSDGRPGGPERRPGQMGEGRIRSRAPAPRGPQGAGPATERDRSRGDRARHDRDDLERDGEAGASRDEPAERARDDDAPSDGEREGGEAGLPEPAEDHRREAGDDPQSEGAAAVAPAVDAPGDDDGGGEEPRGDDH